jgi:alpha-1,3-rhamnosyltransferase
MEQNFKIDYKNPEKFADPLISIIVITYNSGKYVLETLESAKTQTYQNIELIVSDDCSKDNTVEICQKWMNDNKDRFIRTAILTTLANTGIPANCNRGVKAAWGKWVKPIAGDDVLIKSCIQDNVDFISANHEINVLFSGGSIYNETFKPENYISDFPSKEQVDYIISRLSTAEEQFKELQNNNFVEAPSTFIRKGIYDIVGYYDEKYKLIEDYPFWMRLTKLGIKIFYMDKLTVLHRIHPESLTGYDQIVSSYFSDLESIKKDYIYPYSSLRFRLKKKTKYYVLKFVAHIFKSKKDRIGSMIIGLIRKLNPFR